MNEDKSTRYHRFRRRATLLALGARVLLLVGLTVTGWPPILRESARVLSAAGGLGDAGETLVGVMVYGFVIVVACELLVMPVTWYTEVLLRRRYGLSHQPTRGWLPIQCAITGVRALGAAAVVAALYTALWVWPTMWWGLGGLGFAGLMVGVTHLWPSVEQRRAGTTLTSGRPVLARRLTELMRDVGIPVIGVYRWRGDAQPVPNAALVGLGTTRRVLLSDALLEDFSDEEIAVIVAHELAHHVHGDLWSTLAYRTGLVTAALGLAHVLLSGIGPVLGLDTVLDPAGLPLLALGAGGVVTIATPITLGLSRWQERRADQFAVEKTGNGAALVSGLRRLAARGLAEERPSRLVAWFGHAHPPVHERLAAVRLDEDRGRHVQAARTAGA